jgi:hypothetical protein
LDAVYQRKASFATQRIHRVPESLSHGG